MLGADAVQRQAAHRNLFASELEDAPLCDLRVALNQNQPIGNSRLYAEIEAMTDQRRELRKRGRPRKEKKPQDESAQSELELRIN